MSVGLCCRRIPLKFKARLMQPYRNGYIVLLPEVNPNLPENIALMKDFLPDFTNMTTEKCVSTMGKHLLDFEHGIKIIEESIEQDGCTDVVKGIIEPIENVTATMDTTWGIIKNMYMVNTKMMPPGTYVPLHNRARRARSSKFYSKPIYNACKNCDQSNLTEEEERFVNKILLEGRLAGLELTEDKRQELAYYHIKISEAQSDFRKRVEVSSKLFEHVIHDSAVTRDMPDQLLKLMSVNKDEPNTGPWKVTLQPQVKELFLQYCPDRDQRWNVWQASTRVASMSLEDTSLRNSKTLENIRKYRGDLAEILGYKSYAHMSMETKMAGSLENVQQTLGGLLKIARPVADKEIANLQEFALGRGFEGSLEVWDVPFWQRKQKRALFNYQEEELTDYFPFDKVWSGLLDLCERLFDLEFRENTKVDRWHPDVKFFFIYENAKMPIGAFYLDPYMRENKLSTESRKGWVINITPAAKIHKCLPLSTLVLQIEPPMYGKPALLTWREVQELFKQFGHTLQQLMSTVNYAEVSGQSNVEWDAVGIVENVFLHWLKDPEVLESISGHYATGEKLPPLPLADMEKHLAGYRLCEELFKAHLDLEMHTSKDFWQEIMTDLWRAHFPLPHDKWDSTPCSFNEVITEQWGAAYFSHLWAKMVAADVYSAFTEPDVDTKAIAARFRHTYLSFGGSCAPGEVFRRFRGRDPSSEAFLKDLGLH